MSSGLHNQITQCNEPRLQILKKQFTLSDYDRPTVLWIHCKVFLDVEHPPLFFSLMSKSIIVPNNLCICFFKTKDFWFSLHITASLTDNGIFGFLAVDQTKLTLGSKKLMGTFLNMTEIKWITDWKPTKASGIKCDRGKKRKEKKSIVSEWKRTSEEHFQCLTESRPRSIQVPLPPLNSILIYMKVLNMWSQYVLYKVVITCVYKKLWKNYIRRNGGT